MLKAATEAVIAASVEVLSFAESSQELSAWRKTDETLLTTLDLACHETIGARLSKTGVQVLSEESADTHHYINSTGPFFIVDPIDGTSACKRFLRTEGGQVGFGPLVGYVENGKVVVAAYYNIPQRTLYQAVYGCGVVKQVGHPTIIGKDSQRAQIIAPRTAIPLSQTTLLFFISKQGEAPYVDKLVRGGVVQTCSRFGGFANDCVRMAEGFEQVQLQFSVYPWDASAILFMHEVGLRVVFDPCNAARSYDDWVLTKINPILVAASAHIEELGRVIGS